MALLSTTQPTLLDLAKAQDPDGKIATIVEILNETNEILDDMVWVEGNLSTGHKTTLRSGIPAPTWRKIGQGVQPTKGTTVQVVNECGMMEAYAEIDKALADLNGNTNAFRLSEDHAHMEGMNQEMAGTLFYGNSGTAPEEFTGLASYYNDLSAENADNIIDAGGTGTDNASIWLVVWGKNTCHGIIPKGSKAGLQMNNKGQVTIQNSDGSRMEAYMTHYRWDAGLALRDWRYVVRICNIDKSNLSSLFTPGTGFATSSADLGDLMFQAINYVPSMSMGRPVFYMSRDLRTWVARQAAAKGNGGNITTSQVSGERKHTQLFDGVPMRRVDALAADEARVV